MPTTEKSARSAPRRRKKNAETRPKGAINEKQALFCREYLLDNDATKAAIRAGYSPRTASQYAYQLLHKTSVQAEIEITIMMNPSRFKPPLHEKARQSAGLFHASRAGVASV